MLGPGPGIGVVANGGYEDRYGQRVIFVVLPLSLCDSMVLSSITVTLTFSSGASAKLMTPSLYNQLPKGPSLVPSARRSIASAQSPLVPHFPIRNSLVGLSPLAGAACVLVMATVEVAGEAGSSEACPADLVPPPHPARASAAAAATANRIFMEISGS